MADIFMSMEVIIFMWSALISSIFFSNFVLGSNFYSFDSLFVPICSKYSSKDVGSLETLFSWTIIVMKIIWFTISTSVDSEGHIVSEVIVTSLFPILFYF